ncbi:maleylpyruvate isomerase family mycothiol-dependent enzyme [Luteipulveratus mongoliensis]|uniref:Mycothiol-dependent maleylpyruvate isomerase metal-binding domain-containing protein n=1 Tax=Luteipulveratus mongoliensis TaxID=571913 RepID=A0A0K1JHS7_9MICO|nr:maleylpyruvate isomerase family mycothiol-dependent enzyme [Luteipulveratus mongoliensis]AKU16267.1 hypothetical protein VV02_10995 [Luteipulveratus mongoliensis]
MDEDRIWAAIDQERQSLADLLDDLSPDEWQAGSLCEHWTVRDVGAHLTLAHTSTPTALREMVRARGSVNRMIHDTAVRHRPPLHDLSRSLRSMVGSHRTAPGITSLEPLIDALVHGQDIALPLGRTRPVPPEPAAAALERVWTMGWPFHARRRLNGVRLIATDADWSAGSGSELRGPAGAVLLLATGRRPAALRTLEGPGRDCVG